MRLVKKKNSDLSQYTFCRKKVYYVIVPVETQPEFVNFYADIEDDINDCG